MLITITRQGKIQLIDKAKNNRNKIIDHANTVDLFEVLDDLLSIDWIQMASNLFYYTFEDLTQGQEVRENYPFTSYEEFQQWLHYNHCLYKNSINPVTFELLKTQFPTFSAERWDRFFNAIVFLNTENFFTDLYPTERKEVFNKMFPKDYFLSPCKQIEKNSINMLSKFVFSSNLEMLVFDIFKDIYGEKYNGLEYEAFNFCTHLSDSFYKMKRIAEEIDWLYTIERFLNDYFSKECFIEIPPKTYEHIKILFHLLCSREFNGHLLVEFRYRIHEALYGQEKFPLSYFIDADLTDRFSCKKYIYECYNKYEINEIDIFNINEDINLLLLLGSYASAFSNLSFAKCSICGHFFIRNKNNKIQIKCNRCKALINQFCNVTEIQKASQKIQQNSQTAKNRLKTELKNKNSKIYEQLGPNAEIIVNEYYNLIDEYRQKIEDVETMLSQEHILSEYCYLDPLGQLADQIEQERALVPIKSKPYGGMSNFDFKKFYDTRLTRKHFFSPFEEIYVSINKKENSLPEEIELTFEKMESVFSSYDLDVSNLEKIRTEFIRLLNL